MKSIIIAARKGYDIYQDDPKYRTIDSSKNHFKVAFSGSGSYDLNSSNSYSHTITITHNLGFVPVVQASGYYVEADGGTTQKVKISKFTALPYTCIVYTSDDGAGFVASIEKTDSYVKFKFYENTGDGFMLSKYNLSGMKYEYKIFADEE